MSRFATEERSNQTKSSAAGAKRRRFIWFVSMAVFLGWAGYIFFAQNALITDKQDELAKKQENYDNVKKSELQLQYEVARLNDNEYIGQLARKWYNIYPQGEKPIRTEQTEE